MICATCGRQSVWKSLSRAAAKSAGARLRRMGVRAVYEKWAQRAIVCEKCPLRVLREGVAYCGQPFLTQIRRMASEGCGCPISAKAKDRNEHCPLDGRGQPAATPGGACNCKWCGAA